MSEPALRLDAVSRGFEQGGNRLDGSIITVFAANGTELFQSDPIVAVGTTGQLFTFDGLNIIGATRIRVDGFTRFFQFAELRAFGVIPEPGTFALLGLTIAGFTLRRRRNI